MLKFTVEQQERAQRLMIESFVFDYCPIGEPIVLTPRTREMMEESFDAGFSASAVATRMFDLRTVELESDPSIANMMEDYWDRVGVDCIALTLRDGYALPGQTETLLSDIARWHRRISASGYMALVTGAGTAKRAKTEGKIGVMFAMQDTIALPRDSSFLDQLFALGVRIIQLTYNLRNLLGDGCTERTQAGLSRLGIDFVKRMNQLGMIVDLSHCGYQTTIDGIEASDMPVAVTHSLARTIHAHPRAKTDDQIKLLADHRGYFGVTTVPFFVSDQPGPSISLFLDHFDHVVSIMGPERVGLASDWGSWSPDLPEPLRQGLRAMSTLRGSRPEDGMTLAAAPGGAYFEEMRAYTDFGVLAQGLVSRGYTDADIRGFLGQNWLNFLERAGLS